MKKSSKIALLSALVAGIFLTGYLILSQDQPSDQAQIIASLESARAAASARSVSGVMQFVSDKYVDSQGFKKGKLRFLLSQGLKGDDPITVEFTSPNITVNGDTATSKIHEKVRVDANSGNLSDEDITLQWRREDGRKWLVVPTKIWRIVGADYRAPALPF